VYYKSGRSSFCRDLVVVTVSKKKEGYLNGRRLRSEDIKSYNCKEHKEKMPCYSRLFSIVFMISSIYFFGLMSTL
jgi:hypothetical protein